MSNRIVFPILAWVLAANAMLATPIQTDAIQANITSDVNQLTLTVQTGDLQPITVSQDNQNYTQFTIPSEGITYQPDKPILPMVSRFVVVPPQASLELSVQSDEPRIVRSDNPPVLCSDETIVLNQPRDDTPLYPPVIAEMSEPFVIRGVRMVKVTTYPVQYDSENDSYLIRDNITAEVRFGEGEPVNPAYHPNRRHRSREFLKFISALAINGDDVRRDNPEDVSPYVGHYLIVTHESCLEYAVPFIEWRRKSGYKVDILSLSRMVAINAARVKDRIQDRYDDYLDDGIDPFDQILLIGDRSSYNMTAPQWELGAERGNSIWANPHHADYRHACLEGDDHYPDVGFARWPTGNRDLMELVVNKTLAYEAEPYMEETEWFTKGAVFSEHWGLNDNSAWHIGIPMNVRWGVEVLQRRGFDDIEYYEDLVWDRYGEEIMPWMRDIFNEGRNVMIGRVQIWNWRTRFEVNDNVIFPLYIVTNGIGDYAGESIFRTGDGEHLKGAVFNTFAYGDTPTIPMSTLWLEMVNSVMSRDMTAGWSRVMAVTAIEQYIPNFQYRGQPIYLHVKTDFECYGDPGIQPWIGVPHIVTADFPESVTPITRFVELTVMDEDGENPVTGAQVTLYAPCDMPDPDDDDYADYDEMVMRTTTSDEEGVARFVFDEGVEFAEDTPMFLTVTGRDILPLFEEIEIADPEEATVELSGYTLTEQEGNDDGEINPGELFFLELTAINLGNEALQNVEATATPLSPWVEVDEGIVQFGDMDAGAEADGRDVIEVMIHPEIPDGEARPSTRPTVQINFEADGGLNWSSAITLDPHSPCFDVRRVIGGVILDGEEIDLDIEIVNRGRMNSAPMIAELTAIGNSILVVDEESDYNDIDAGRFSRLAGDPFVVSVSPIAIPGSMCDMMMILTGEDEFVDTVFFQLQAGEIAEGEPFGPDDYGYVCFDDTDEGWEITPEYDWIEISREERNRDFDGISCEFDGESDVEGFEDVGESVVVDLGFTAQFYGYEFDQITIGTNGFVAIGDQENIVNFQNWPLDRAIGGGVGMIAPFWDWLKFEDDSQVYYFYDDETGIFIVEWYKLRHFEPGNDDLNFELILFDPERWFVESGDSDIMFQYNTISNVRGPEQGRAPRERNNYYASVGISSPDGTTGISYTWNDMYPIGAAELEERRAILFTTGIIRREGEIFGVVTDVETGDPIPQARLITTHGFVSFSDDEGNYSIEHAPAEISFTLTATAEGYLDSTRGDLNVPEDESIEVNFGLFHADFELSEQELRVEIIAEEQTSVDLPFSVENSGNGVLEWFAEKRLPDNAHLDSWELRQSLSAGEEVENSRLKGVVFVDDHYYVSGGGSSARDDNFVYILNREGELVDAFQQFGDSRYGMGDLAYDGELIWGGEDNIIYGFTPEGEVESFEGPFNPCQAVAWDSDRELLWICAKTSRYIAGYTREGEEVAQLARHGLTVYGLAHTSVDPGFLYVYHNVHNQGEVDHTEVHKISTGTGDVEFVARIDQEGRPEGAFITNRYDPYSTVFVSIENTSDPGDTINVWQLETNTSWFDLDSYDGVLNPDHNVELTLMLDAEDLIPLQDEQNMSWNAELFFTTNSMQGDVRLPIFFDVILTAPTESERLSPEEFGMTAIYPNPFNAQISISYDVPSETDVSLELFDINGRLVTTLVERRLTAGSFTTHWDGSALTSGIYLIRLKSDERAITRKIVLVR